MLGGVIEALRLSYNMVLSLYTKAIMSDFALNFSCMRDSSEWIDCKQTGESPDLVCINVMGPFSVGLPANRGG